ncbi:MAG: terminase family protein [Hyphomicrobiaceae bacterium]
MPTVDSAGKTVACINELIKAALTCEKEAPRFGYLAPYYAQAKDIAWDYLKRYTAPIPSVGTNESELRVDLPNGARIRLYGGENADRIRGVYFDGIVVDEPADIDPRVWPEIIRPALADRQGWAAFIGTPKGRNAFYELVHGDADGKWPGAVKSPEWFSLILKASETGLLAQEELDAAKIAMSEDQYQQEFECSFDAAIQGSYYGALLNELEGKGRMRELPHNPEYGVYTAWDLGVGDSTAIWFCQLAGKDVHLIDFYQNSGVGMSHYVEVLKAKPYHYVDHIWPHDADSSEKGTGRTVVQTMGGMGMFGRVLPRSSPQDGIMAVRLLLQRCWFDRGRCWKGIELLKQYRREFDENKKTFKDAPYHDFTSDAADAFRYLAMGLPDAWSDLKPKDRYATPRRQVGSWMTA